MTQRSDGQPSTLTFHTNSTQTPDSQSDAPGSERVLGAMDSPNLTVKEAMRPAPRCLSTDGSHATTPNIFATYEYFGSRTGTLRARPLPSAPFLMLESSLVWVITRLEITHFRILVYGMSLWGVDIVAYHCITKITALCLGCRLRIVRVEKTRVVSLTASKEVQDVA